MAEEEEKSTKSTSRVFSGGQMVVLLVLVLAALIFPPMWIPVAIYVIYRIYVMYYFGSENFKNMRGRISEFIDDYNNLNKHIEDLKACTIHTEEFDEAAAKRAEKAEYTFPLFATDDLKIDPKDRILECSQEICDEAKEDPFGCLCKYFGIGETQDSLEKVETMLNNFEAVEAGTTLLENERARIGEAAKNELPWALKTFTPAERVASELNLEPANKNSDYFPRYLFKYSAPNGNILSEYEIVLDREKLNDFVAYLGEKVPMQKNVAEKRELFTSELRQEVLERDNYTCKQCGVHKDDVPNLLLEVDYITPLSKGGITCEDNLQTLCWHCKTQA